jgi:RimJ/RimL family protein N-acetyltransferase
MNYKSLKIQTYKVDKYSIVPIRFEDKFQIMKWRNEQIYHLRQSEILTRKKQDQYFNDVVSQLFIQNKPNQILFSYLKNAECIGYGGLVHINWLDKNAEISFVLKTDLEKNNFVNHWKNFLKLIEKVAFKDLNFHKIFTFAFDLRPKLYIALEESNYCKESVLKEHCFINNNYRDVVIHSKINTAQNFFLKPASQKHMRLLFEWVNDPNVRNNAINQANISWEQHQKWFNNKIKSKNSCIFILMDNEQAIGQIRIDKNDKNSWIIDYSIAQEYRGNGFGTLILKKLLKKKPDLVFEAMVKKNNIASNNIFQNLNFKLRRLSDNINLYTYG